MSKYIINIFKFVVAVFLMPVVISASINFYSQLNLVEEMLRQKFFFGIFSFLLIYLFIYEPLSFYQKGRRIVEIIFKFFAPLVKIASFCLPIYTILFLLFFLFTSLVLKEDIYAGLLIFLIGFSLILHLVFSAKVLKSNESDFLFASYFFSIEFIYLLNIFLIAFAFNYLIKGFSFINFYHQTFAMAKDIYITVIGQLFFVKKA